MYLLASIESSYTKSQKIAIGVIAFYLLSAIVFNLIFLLETVPIDISGQTEDSKRLAAQGVSYQSLSGSLIGTIVGTPTNISMHLTLIVIFAGSLGGLIHGISRLASHAEKGNFKTKEIFWYVSRPFVGAALALAVYFAFRGGILTSVSVDIFNPYGVATIAVVTGLASDPATKKLKQLFEVFFPKAD